MIIWLKSIPPLNCKTHEGKGHVCLPPVLCLLSNSDWNTYLLNTEETNILGGTTQLKQSSFRQEVPHNSPPCFSWLLTLPPQHNHSVLLLGKENTFHRVFTTPRSQGLFLLSLHPRSCLGDYTGEEGQGAELGLARLLPSSTFGSTWAAELPHCLDWSWFPVQNLNSG